MINKDTDLILDKICRSCMNQNEQMHNVFATNSNNLQFSEMLMACASIQISSDDGLPFLLCHTCEQQLNTAYSFKQQCEKSDSVLRKLTITTTNQEELIVKPDVHESLYDDDDNLPLITKAKKATSTFPCLYCQKILQTKKGLRVHERKHTGEKLRYCFICNAQFTRTNHLMRHLNTHDKSGVEHSCDKCEEKFAVATLLFAHRNLVHKEEEKKEFTAEITAGEDCENEEVEEENSESELQYVKGPAKKRASNKDKALYECQECSKVMTTYVGLRIHMRRHTGDDLSECPHCEKSFTKKSHLNRHMQVHGIDSPKVRQNEKEKDKEKKIIECEFCDRKFKYKKSFQHHMQLEHGMSEESEPGEEIILNIINDTKESNDVAPAATQETTTASKVEFSEDKVDETSSTTKDDYFSTAKPNKVYTCHVCQAGFSRPNHLTRHMTLHRAVLVHKCDRCDKAFASSEYLEKHVEEEHINKPYVCTICNKPFSRGEHLIRHLKIHERQTDTDEKLKCSICDHSFTRSDHLARHTKIHLLQDKRHICFECGKGFNRLDNLKNHQRIHTGIKDNSKLHLCIYCGKEFSNSSNMIVHMRRHTGERPYKCGQCGKGFPRSHDLKCHERTHSGEKPYLCTLCGKSFNKSNKLLRHSRVHTGERPYVCNICSRAFTQSNDLALHMRRHTGARPYACGVCPLRFIQSGQLKTHRRTTGHWMETQPDLKGGHRVEPVTPASEPTPIRFKSHQPRPMVCAASVIEQHQQQGSIYMGILNDLSPAEMSTLEINSAEKLEITEEPLVESVIQTTDGTEIKFKSDVIYGLPKVEKMELQEQAGTSSTNAFQSNVVAVEFSTVGASSTTYTTATDNFTFQTFN